MSDFLTLRQINHDFRRLSSAFLRTRESDGLAYVKRLYNFINQEQHVKKCIDSICSSSDYNCNDLIIEDGYSGQKLIIPDNEADHIKAMYDLLNSLALQEPPIYLAGFSRSFDSSNMDSDRAIQSFLDKAFKPLIHYIIGSLSKEMMALEEHIPTMQFNQNIGKLIGTANTGQNVISVNYSIQSSDLSDILNLLSTFRIEIESSLVDNEEKEFVLDDLAQVEEQVKSNTLDQIRTKKAINGIKKFIESLTTKVVANVVVANGQTLIATGSELLNRLRQIISCA